MTGDELRALQAPLKQKYKDDPASAQVTLRARGELVRGAIAFAVEGERTNDAGKVVSGLHPATGGDGSLACSGDMLLQSLVACSGVTLASVATAMGIALRGATITAEGDLDFRGTLGVAKDAPVGFTAIRLIFAFDSDETADKLEKLMTLTERYCVVLQTLKTPPTITAAR